MAKNPPSVAVSEVNQIVADFCASAIREPLSWFSEADLQADLYAHLIAKYSALIETKVKRGAGSKGTYRNRLVHREYGVGEKKRMDLVILTPADVAAIDTVNMQISTNPAPGYLTPFIGIELGTEKTSEVEGHLDRDLKKLNKKVNPEGRGYLIYFYRDTAVADTGTQSRENTEDRIDRDLRAHLQKMVGDAKSHVKVLCFLIRTGRKQKWINGKCEMFKPGSPEGEWVAINLKDLETEILSIL